MVSSVQHPGAATDDPDRRDGNRLPLCLNGVLRLHGRAPMPARTFNASLLGLGVDIDEPLRAGEHCAVEFGMLLPDGRRHLFQAQTRVQYSFLSCEAVWRLGLLLTHVDRRSHVVLASTLRRLRQRAEWKESFGASATQYVLSGSGGEGVVSADNANIAVMVVQSPARLLNGPPDGGEAGTAG